MYLWLYGFMVVCKYGGAINMYICIYVFTQGSIYVKLYKSMYVYTYVCIYVYMYIHNAAFTQDMYIWVYVYMGSA